MRSRRLIGELFLIVALASAVSACGGSSGGSSSTAPTPAEQKAAITKSWETFFDGTTPTAKRVALLAGGEQFSSEIETLSASPLARQTSATVSDVALTGPTSATVTFSVSLAGNPVLTDVQGNAVLVDGEWKLDAPSFCQLLAQIGSAPAGCSGTGATP